MVQNINFWTILITIVMGINVYALYKLVRWILENFSKKKWIPAILGTILIIGTILCIKILPTMMNAKMNMLFLMIAVIAVIGIVPLIITIINGTKALSRKNPIRKIVELAIYIVIFFTIQFSCYNLYRGIFESTGEILQTSAKELFKTKEQIEDESIDVLLNSYLEIQNSQGYLGTQDTKMLLKMLEKYLKSKQVKIQYTDKENDIQIETDNSTKENLDEIQKELENYLRYSITYEYSQSNSIEKIKIMPNEKEIVNAEKNQDIHLENSQLKETNIEMIEKTGNMGQFSDNYVFKNKINIQTENKELTNLKFAVVYQDAQKNFAPLTSEENEIGLIDTYMICSSRMEITLKQGVNCKKTDYTMRINRYNENLEVEKQYNYKYIYEPVVAIETNAEGNQVLVIPFNKTYTLKELKNIEIIF